MCRRDKYDLYIYHYINIIILAHCVDTANGKTDRQGDGCDVYDPHPGYCGLFDTADFISQSMCCACNGGRLGNCEKYKENWYT